VFVSATALLIFVYLLFRVILRLPAGKGCKAAAGVLLLVFTQQHLAYRYFLGSLASPELPFPLLLFSVGMFIFLLFLCVFFLLGDIALGLRLLFGARRVAGGGFSPGRRQALMTCLAVVPAVHGLRGALAVPEVHKVRAALPGLPRGLDGFTLVQISDLHVSALLHAPRVRAVVEKINALKPDMVVFTGDMVDGLPGRRAESVAPLRDLKAEYGVFACAGNHEYYADFQAWMKAFRELGLTMLLNGHKCLSVGGETMILAGLVDPVAKRYGLPGPDIGLALKDAPSGAFTVLLDHRPVNAAANARAGVNLQLSGHTHGGQILGMRELVRAYNQGYLYGWYQVAAMRMYVSSGAGLWNGFPVRLGVPSEIVYLTLGGAG
jgi:predicted MPP superfamily phosphohydrolase